eukprot:9469593-Pyramimonas_sp.AAC.1
MSVMATASVSTPADAAMSDLNAAVNAERKPGSLKSAMSSVEKVAVEVTTNAAANRRGYTRSALSRIF